MLSNNKWLVLVVVSTALFLISIDMTVLYTALPRLTHDLAATTAKNFGSSTHFRLLWQVCFRPWVCLATGSGIAEHFFGACLLLRLLL